jgi:hypothetical protein
MGAESAMEEDLGPERKQVRSVTNRRWEPTKAIDEEYSRLEAETLVKGSRRELPVAYTLIAPFLEAAIDGHSRSKNQNTTHSSDNALAPRFPADESSMLALGAGY